MSHNWKIATERPERMDRRRRVAPYVSINKRGEIAMNSAAYREIREPANVTLLYDPMSRCIGIKFPVAADRNFFRVRLYGRGRRMRIVRAARMLKEFGIEISETVISKNCRAQDLNGQPMLILDLDGE